MDVALGNRKHSTSMLWIYLQSSQGFSLLTMKNEAPAEYLENKVDSCDVAASQQFSQVIVKICGPPSSRPCLRSTPASKRASVARSSSVLRQH